MLLRPRPWKKISTSTITTDRERLEWEARKRANNIRIEKWIDSICEAGCSPWDEHGRNLPEVPVGYLPEEEWVPYLKRNYGGYFGNLKYLWREMGYWE